MVNCVGWRRPLRFGVCDVPKGHPDCFLSKPIVLELKELERVAPCEPVPLRGIADSTSRSLRQPRDRALLLEELLTRERNHPNIGFGVRAKPNPQRAPPRQAGFSISECALFISAKDRN
jgi:hypothetical protein